MTTTDDTSSPHKQISYFGLTDYRGRVARFGIKQADRHSHMYLIGKTGVGKSTLLESLIRQDIQAGRGLALIDPHGDLAEKVLEYLPEERKSDLIYFNVPDAGQSLGFNPIEPVSPARRSLAAGGLLEVFKKLWADSWGPRLEHILRNALLGLFDQERATLADILRLFNDPNFRKTVANSTDNTQVRDFWLREYERYPERFRSEAVAPIQNKVGAFLSDPLLNRILTQERSSFKLRRVMDEGKILVVNLAKGRLGEDTAGLLGSLLVSRIGLAAISRADVPEAERRDFFVYLDEFQSFTTMSLATMLSELRKYHVGLILAHQYLAQLSLPMRDAVLGNAGTVASFRIGLSDAELLVKEFYPEFSAGDLVNLPNYHIYLKLMIDGRVSRPFSARTLGPST
jgi:GTPase SAR1 family protein